VVCMWHWWWWWWWWCTDINECDLGTHNCHQVADCDNLHGYFKCTCPANFTGDGHSCEGQISVSTHCQQYYYSKVKSLLKRYSCSRQVISELRGITCRMGSHSVTCHQTQVNSPHLTPAKQAGTRFTYPWGWKAELT